MYSEATLIYHGIPQMTGKMIKIVFFLHLPTNKNFQSKMIKNNLLCIVNHIKDHVLDLMEMILVFVIIRIYQMKVVQP